MHAMLILIFVNKVTTRTLYESAGVHAGRDAVRPGRATVTWGHYDVTMGLDDVSVSRDVIIVNFYDVSSGLPSPAHVSA